MERQAEHYYMFGPFRLEPEQSRLLRDGLLTPLPPKTFALLLALVRNHGRLVEKEALMQQLWPDAFVEEANLTFHVSVLRKTLGQSAHEGGYIETAPKRGYRFRAPVREVREETDIKSIAVLPFSAPDSQTGEYFAGGMHEALISELAQIRGLRVISRTSSQHYGTAGRPLPELARALNIDVAVEGCVFLEGDRARIDIRLVDALEDRHLWAHRYERNLRDLLSLQRELACAIVSQIQVKLTKREEERLGQAHPVHPEALTACLRGRYYWDHFTETGMQQAIALFQQAIEIDSSYAQAWAGLSACYSAMAVQSIVAPRAAAVKAHRTAQQAIQLDPLLPDAHLTIAATRLFFDWDWRGAERALATAIDLSPSLSGAHNLFTHYALAQGWGEHAIASARRALELAVSLVAPNRDCPSSR
jgi:TolB-like protein